MYYLWILVSSPSASKSRLVLAAYPWETSTSAICTRLADVFPRVCPRLPTSYSYSCHALVCDLQKYASADAQRHGKNMILALS